MPGTYRYSATFDRTYEEESPPLIDDRSRSKIRQTSRGRSLSDYGDNRSASTDSLDSFCESSSSSTSHSRQLSTDSSEHIRTRMVTKVTAKPAHNPLQFVKVGTSPVYRKPDEQTKKGSEPKVAKEKIKDDAEEWQSNLDSWKSRRRKQSEGSLLRLEEIRRIEMEEQERKQEQKKIKTKTFSEMMEERAHRPKQYNLVIYGRNTSEDEMKSDDDTDNASCTKSDSIEDSDKAHSDSTLCSNSMEETIHNGTQSINKMTTENGKVYENSTVCKQHITERNNNYEYILDKGMKEKLLTNNGCTNTDSGLDSLSSSHKAGDLADSASDFSQDSGSSLDSDFQHTAGSLTTGVELLEEFSSNSLSNFERKTDNGLELFLRIWLKQGCDSKDFGFSLKKGENQTTPIVNSVIPGGVGDLAGLRKGDQILAINGECVQGHEHEIMHFAIQQASYSGHLDLLIWRPTDSGNQETRERSNSLVSQRKSAFENGTQQKKSIQRTNKDIKSATDFKEKVCSFERRSSTDISRECSNLVSRSHASRKPPPVPNKPRLRAKSMPDANFFIQANGDCSSFLEDNDLEEENKETSIENLNYKNSSDSDCINNSEQSAITLCTEENYYYSSEKNVLDDQNSLHKSNSNSDEQMNMSHDSANTEINPIESNCNENEKSKPYRLISLNPVCQDQGLNIIYDSHPVQNSQQNIQLSDGIRSSEVKQTKEDQMENQHCEASINNNETKQKNSSEKSSSVKKPTEKQKTIKNVKEEQNKEEILKLQCDFLNSDMYQITLDLNHEDMLLADLDNSPRQLEPPKEKPPPPPPDESDVENSENASFARVNKTKEIKRELWKRRSDFLGIEFEDGIIEVDDSQVPPPPAIEDILKSERELERENRQLLEQQTILRLQKLAEEEEIARKEREIIENIEREERERQKQQLELEIASKKEEENKSSNSKKESNEQHQSNNKEQISKNVNRSLKQDQSINRKEKLQNENVLQEREEYIKKQENPEKAGCVHPIQRDKESKNSIKSSSKISPSLPQNTSSTKDNNSEPPNRVPTKKMIIRQERERLRREQEALQKQREEYEHQKKKQEQKWLQQKIQSTTQQKCNDVTSLQQNKVPNQTSPRNPSVPVQERDDIICASRRPQAVPSLPDNGEKHKENSENEYLNHEMSQSQAMTKKSLHSLGAAPKAKIVNNEQWIKPNEKVTKRRSEPPTESGYNQYHWLVQEAEMRRIMEHKERQFQHASDYRSAHNRSVGSAIPLRAQNHTSMIPNNQKQLQNHPTHCALPCGYVIDQQWSRNSSTSNGRYNGLTHDKSQSNRYLKSHRDISPAKPPRSMTSNNQEHLLSVSGRKRCSHCGEELGRGAAMIIESLQLFYHIQCFCCCVCQAQLGNGSCGTDVRVRNNKLHCQHCYSNDEAGLKFSQV